MDNRISPLLFFMRWRSSPCTRWACRRSSPIPKRRPLRCVVVSHMDRSRLTESSLQESCVHAVTEARRCAPSILYWPRADTWWETGSSSLQTTLLMLLDDIPSSCPVLVLATADAPWPDLPDQVQGIFNRALATSIDLSLPTGPQRREYFSVLGDKICIRSPEPDQPPLERLEPLPVVEPAKSSPGVEPSTSTDNEQEKCLRALRLFLRALTTRLMSEFRVRALADMCGLFPF